MPRDYGGDNACGDGCLQKFSTRIKGVASIFTPKKRIAPDNEGGLC
jgi:hypothetical protein